MQALRERNAAVIQQWQSEEAAALRLREEVAELRDTLEESEKKNAALRKVATLALMSAVLILYVGSKRQ